LSKAAVVGCHLDEELLMLVAPDGYLALCAVPRSLRLRAAVVQVPVLLVQRIGEIRDGGNESVKGEFVRLIGSSHV
jgi:hypothetical protein